MSFPTAALKNFLEAESTYLMCTLKVGHSFGIDAVHAQRNDHNGQSQSGILKPFVLSTGTESQHQIEEFAVQSLGPPCLASKGAAS